MIVAGEGLPVPPEGVDATVAHEGVEWRSGSAVSRGRALARAAAACAVWVGTCVIALGAGAPLLVDALVLAVGGACALVAALAFLQGARRTRLWVDDRTMLVERLGALGSREVHRLAMADLRSFERETDPAGTGAAWIVVRTRDERVVLGEGEREEVLDWLLAVLEAAARGQARRARAEGREWGFLRTAPAELRRLSEPPT